MQIYEIILYIEKLYELIVELTLFECALTKPMFIG